MRLLGVDAPEISFVLPNGGNRFTSIGNLAWQAFLKDPFDTKYGALKLDSGLESYIRACCEPNEAKAHYNLAVLAQRTFGDQLTIDVRRFGGKGKFEFFVAFGQYIVSRFEWS